MLRFPTLCRVTCTVAGTVITMGLEDGDEDDWVVEGDRRLIRPVEAAPVHRARDTARLVRLAVIAVLAVIVVVLTPVAVRWARDSLAEITQVTTATTRPTG